MSKDNIRKLFLKKRQNLKKEEVENKSKAIANNFINNLLPKFSNFSDKKLAFYIAAGNEANPKSIMEYINKIGNIICLPRITENNKLSFRQYNIENDELEKNNLYKNIFEPKLNKIEIKPDIVFVPLVAFDKECNRIGMGKGFYDFTIQNIRSSHENTTFIGLAYDLQLYDKIPTNKFDQILNFIITENIIYKASKIKG